MSDNGLLTSDQAPSDVRGTHVTGDGGWLLERSCCCPSRPVVRVVISAGRDRQWPVDLLLCGHHFRASRDGLAASGVAVYDRSDELILC